MKKLISLLALLGAAWPSSARAAEIPRDVYLEQMPLGTPKLIQQTDASVELHLYGDRSAPSYRDADPVDGIDDARYEVLMALAVRFAPFLVQNTSEIPVNFDVYVENREVFALNWDRWDVTDTEPHLLESKSLNVAALGRTPCATATERVWDEHPQATTNGRIEDCKLVDLLDQMAPITRPALEGDPRVQERPQFVDVLFYDFPGEGESTWKLGYVPEYERSSKAGQARFPHAYVHPFLREDGGRGYELTLQYWFFYPSNDSGMDHEGDWEHMNVVVAPRSKVEQALSEIDVQRMLTTLPADDAVDPLVIRRVDYYFHHLVMTLDFSSPNVYLPREDWQEDVDTRPWSRFQEQYVWKAIREMAYVDSKETVVNTHPFGYIGSDNKGLNQALAVPGGRNRNAHGTYPLPGRYQHVGPGASTDQISVHVDPRRYLRRWHAGKASMGPTFERGSVLGLADPDRLRIVPDWERIVDLTRDDAVARREWSWLILPLHWGYPATTSPFSGVLEHYNTGNVAPVGPSFNDGWNVSGPSPGFSPYEPHTIPSVFPLEIQDNFRNDLGFLNLTLPTLLNLPPLDFATRVVAYPFKAAFKRRDPVYYPKEGVPFRFLGFSSGVSVQRFAEDYDGLVLSPNQFDQFFGRFILHFLTSDADSTTTIVSGEEIHTTSVQPFFQLSFYLGGHFASENTIRNARTQVGFDVEFNNIPDYRYRADINYWEYAGSLRYSPLTSRVQPFAKIGYGWSWYRAENIEANDIPFDPDRTDWIGPDSIWPNVWHFGLGLEYVPFRRVGLFPGGVELAFRLEYGRYYETLGLDLSEISLDRLSTFFTYLGEVPGGEHVIRNDYTFGMTLSF